MELVAVPIGHAGKILTTTQQNLAQALSATRPEIERARTRRNAIISDTDSVARSHDSSLFKSSMRTLTKIAQSRLIGIIHHRHSIVKARVGVISRTHVHLDATPTHTQVTHQQGEGGHSHTYNARTAPTGEHRDHKAPDSSLSMPLRHLPHRTVYL